MSIKKFLYWTFTIFGLIGAGLSMLLSEDAEGKLGLDNPFGYFMLFVAFWNIMIFFGKWSWPGKYE